jgi:hypothetical protein
MNRRAYGSSFCFEKFTYITGEFGNDNDGKEIAKEWLLFIKNRNGCWFGLALLSPSFWGYPL